MNWTPIARKEFHQVIRSRPLWALAALALAVAYWGFGISKGIASPRPAVLETLGPGATIAAFQLPVELVFGLAALLVSYRSIAAERTSRSLLWIASQPHTKRDIVLGKTIGRAAGTCLALLAVFVLGGVSGVVHHGPFSMTTFLGVYAASATYVAGTVAIAIGISASVRTRTRAVALVVSYYLPLVLLWEGGFSLVVYNSVARRFVPYERSALLAARMATRRMVPIGAYDVMVNGLLGLHNAAEIADIVVLIEYGNPYVVPYVDQAFPRSVPIPYRPWFGIVVIAAWTVFALGIGYWKFAREDIV